MKFEAKSLGIFEVLTLRVEASEVFDADLLRQAVQRMLERDVRQIVIDVSSLEYLYSDAINVLVSINRRVLEKGGRLGILATQGRLRDILLRSGLDSLFRIYKSEGDLSVEATEFLRQSTMIAREAGSSTSYAQAIKPVTSDDGPSTRRFRKRSGARKEQPRRRPDGRRGVSAADAASQASSGSLAGSSFPEGLAWDADDSVPEDVPSSLELYSGPEAPAEPPPSRPSIPLPLPPPDAFFPPPPLQEE